MNKKLPFLAVAGLMLSSNVLADMAGIEVGAYQWSPDYSGVLAVDDGSNEGTELNLEDDLGYADEDHNIIWASIEHPVPFIPNFKITSYFSKKLHEESIFLQNLAPFVFVHSQKSN